jgi:predicted nucleic acid-binding Zn ribbon protein
LSITDQSNGEINAMLYNPQKSRRQVTRHHRHRRCAVCGQRFASEPTTKPRRFCGDRCRDAARRQRNHVILGIARISKNRPVFSKGCKVNFGGRGSGIAGTATVIEVEIIAGRFWHEVLSPDGVKCWSTISPVATTASAEATALITTIPDNLSIPAFLKRDHQTLTTEVGSRHE